MRERLLAQLQARLEQADAGDPKGILDPQALAEVRTLLKTIDDPVTDLEVALTSGWLHWARYQFLPEGDDQEDLEAALELFAALYPTRPSMLPEQVRVLFDQNMADDPQAWAARASALLQATLQNGDSGHLNEAIDLLTRTLAPTPADHPDRAVTLSNLGAALQTRFERVGEIADLDAAIVAGREAVAIAVAPPLIRAGAARGWGWSAAAGKRWEQATAGFTAASQLYGPSTTTSPTMSTAPSPQPRMGSSTRLRPSTTPSADCAL